MFSGSLVAIIDSLSVISKWLFVRSPVTVEFRFQVHLLSGSFSLVSNGK